MKKILLAAFTTLLILTCLSACNGNVEKITPYEPVIIPEENYILKPQDTWFEGFTTTPLYLSRTDITKIIFTDTKPEDASDKVVVTSSTNMDETKGVFGYYKEEDEDKVIYIVGEKIIGNADSSFMFSNSDLESLLDYNYAFISVTEINFGHFDTSRIKNIGAMFYFCISLNKIENISNWNTTSLETMAVYYGENPIGAFSYCLGPETLDLSGWDTSKITDMSSLFDSEYDNIKELNLSGWDTSKVTSLNNMFGYRKCIERIIGIESFNTSNTKDTSDMFDGCKNLMTVDLSNWNTENVTDMANMFSFCTSLSNLDLSNWNTENVTNMASMFQRCEKLNNINGIKYFDTSKVIKMSEVFSGCKSLKELDLSLWETDSVSDMRAMFKDCKSLTNLHIEKFTSCTQMNDMFGVLNYDDTGCDNLTNVYVNNDIGLGPYLNTGTNKTWTYNTENRKYTFN